MRRASRVRVSASSSAKRCWRSIVSRREGSSSVTCPRRRSTPSTCANVHEHVSACVHSEVSTGREFPPPSRWLAPSLCCVHQQSRRVKWLCALTSMCRHRPSALPLQLSDPTEMRTLVMEPLWTASGSPKPGKIQETRARKRKASAGECDVEHARTEVNARKQGGHGRSRTEMAYRRRHWA
jgi:hypothetical protein